MDTTIKILTVLALSGCFKDTMSVDEGDSDSSSSDSSSGDAGSDTATTGVGEDGASGEGGNSEDESTTEPEGSEHGDTSESSGTESSGGTNCESVEIPVDSPMDAGSSTVLSVDFDELPGTPGALAEVCLEFTTTNNASARSMTIGGQLFGFGPCGSGKPLYIYCREYIKPLGVVDITVDNFSGSPGCQSGPMDSVILRFGCLEN